MAEEVSSLLLRVGVDFAALEGFVAAMPEIVGVAEQVGAALNATQIGNPELFRSKGEQLTRALVTGLQAGALGLEFAGGSIAEQITNRVFGKLDRSTANAYVRDVQALMLEVQRSLPQLDRPLINQQSLSGLGQVSQMAAGARRELEAMSGQLDQVLARMSALSAVRLPKTLVRRTADRSGVELTPGAQRAAAAIGVTPAVPRSTNVAGSSADVGMQLVVARRQIQADLERQQANLQRVIGNGQRIIEASQVIPADPNTGRAFSIQSDRAASSVDRLARAADSATRALERAADRAERATGPSTVTRAGELFSRQEVATQAAQVRGQVTVFEAVAEAQRTTQTGVERAIARGEALLAASKGATTAAEASARAAAEAQRLNALEGRVVPPVGGPPTGPLSREEQAEVGRRAQLHRGGYSGIQLREDRLKEGFYNPGRSALEAAAAEADAAAARRAAGRERMRASRDAAREAEQQMVTLFRGEKTGGVRGWGAEAYGDSTYLSDRRFFAREPITALDYAAMGLGPTGRLLAAQVPQGVLNSIGGANAGEYPLPKRYADEARVIMEGTNEQLRRFQEVLRGTGPMDVQPALTRGFGNTGDVQAQALAENARRRQEALYEREAERRGRELVANRFGAFELGYNEDTSPRQTAAAGAAPSARAITQFLRSTNEDILRGLETQLRLDGLTANTPDTSPESLRRALGASAYDRLVTGQGLGPVERLRLSEEQREALGDTNARSPKGRLAPPMLIDRAQAAREFVDPRGQFVTPTVRELRERSVAARELLSIADRARQLQITAGSPFDPRLAPAVRTSAADVLRAQASQAALARAGRIPEFLGMPGFPNVAGGIPGAPPLTRGAAPAPEADLVARARAAADAAQRNLTRLTAAGATTDQLAPFQAAVRDTTARLAELAGTVRPTTGAGGLNDVAAQRAAEVTYLRNIAAARRLDDALARLAQQIEATAAAANRGGQSSLRALGAMPQGLSSLLGITAPVGGGIGLGSTLDARLQDARAALPPGRGAQSLAGRGVVPLRVIEGEAVRPADERAARLEREYQARRAAIGLPPGAARPDMTETQLRAAQAQQAAAQAQQAAANTQQAAATAAAGGAGAGGRGGGRGGVGGGTPPLGGQPIPPSGQPGRSFFGRARQFARQTFADEDTFFGGVRKGFSGGDEGGTGFFGRSVGSAARFSLVYGAAYSALRLFTTAFGEGVRGATEFETALTDLNIATERTGRSNEAFAFQLANLGAGRGFAPGEAVQAGARAVGLFGATDQSRGRQEEIATVSTDVATKIAFISGQTLEQVQTQLAGITRSFNVDPLQQERIFDVASFVGRRSGRPAGELLQSLGQIGSLGGDAGFSLEQTAAIIARLTSTTGQTPQAVSGFLSQVLSRADDPRLQGKLREVGVETEGTTLAQQIEQLSGLGLPQETTNRIIAGFGRGRSGQALGIILEQFPEIQKLAAGAAGAQGLGDRDFEQAVNTVGGQLRVLGSSLKDLFTGIASSGILDVFVLLLSAAQGLVDALDAVVDVFNLIPREARSAAFMLLEVYAALLLLSKIGPVATAAARVAGLSIVDDKITGSRRQRAGAVGSLIAGGARTGVVGTAARVGALASSAPLIGGLIGGGALAGGVLLGAAGAAAAVGVGIWKAFSEAAAVDRGIENTFTSIFTATDKAGFDTARGNLAVARKAQEEQDDFKFLSKDIFTLGGANIFNDATGRSRLDRDRIAQAERELEAREKANQEATKAAVDRSPGAAFDGFLAGSESVSNGFTVLADKGFTATRQLDALNQAFDALVEKSDTAAGSVGVILAGQLDLFTQTLGADTTTAAGSFAAGLRARSQAANAFEAGGFGETVVGGTRDTLATLIGGTVGMPVTGPAAALGRLLGNRDAGKTGGDAALDVLRASVSPLVGEKGDRSVTGLIGGIFREFDPTRDNGRERAKKLRLGNQEITSTLADAGVQDGLASVTEQALRAQGKSLDGPISLTKADADAIKKARNDFLRSQLGPAFDKLPKDIQEAFFAEMDKGFDETLGAFNGTTLTAQNATAFLAGVREKAQAAGEELALTSGDQLAGAQLTLQQFAGRRQVVLDAIKNASSPEEADSFRRVLELLDLDIARAAQTEFQKRSARIDALVGLGSAQVGGDPLQSALINIGGVAAKLRSVRDEDERLALEAELANQGFAFRKAQASTQSSMEKAGIDPRNSVGLAEAGVRDARRQLEVAIPGTQGYYDAVAALNQAQVAYADAQLEASRIMLFKGIDPQDTVALAEAEVKAAKEKLAALQKPLPAASPLADFDTAGNQVGTVDVTAKGKGIGQQVLQGLLANNYTGAGASIARQLLSGMASATAGTGVYQPGVSPGPAPTNVQNASGLPLAVLQGKQAYIDGTGASLFPGYTPEQIKKAQQAYATEQAAYQQQFQGTGSPGTAVLPGRQGTVLTGGSFATSGVLAPKPGQLTLANRSLIDLIVGSGAAFGKLDGNIVPRRTADGGISSHSFGNALDIFGTPAELAALVKQLTPLAGNGLKELLYTPTGTFLGKGGRAFTPSANVVKNHRDHIHAQVDDPAAVYAAAKAAGVNVNVQPTSAEVEAQRQEVARREREAMLARQARDIARLNSTLDPRNSLDRARADLRIAQRILRDESGNKGTEAYYNALTGVNEAKVALARAEAARAYARDQAGAVRAQSPLAAAASSLRTATDRLKNEVPRTKEWYEAQADLYKAQQEFAEATREAQAVSLRLASDITDPVAQAAIDLRTARAKVDHVRRNGGDRNAIEAAQLEEKQAAATLEQSVFDQRLNRARTDAELGRTSQAAYIEFLRSEEARLGAIKDRTQQQQNQYDQIQRELLNVNKQLSGQFNIGDIDVPTPYDARRLMTERLAREQAAAEQQMPGPWKRTRDARPYTPNIVGGGVDMRTQEEIDAARSSITSQLASTSYVYNQQGSTNTTNVYVNGGDLNEVKTVMAQYLGASAFQRSSVSTAKV